MLDDGLKQQTAFDLDCLQRATSCQLSKKEATQFLSVQHQAMRWTFLGSGMTHTNFLASVEALVTLQILVSGTHLCGDFGETANLLKTDGLCATAEVEMVLSADTPVAAAMSLGLGTIRYAHTLDALQPDIVVVLGDRYEALAFAQAAMVLKIPIAHIHGGEATEGVIDEAIRHAISKMAHLHFTAAEAYRRRVVQLGEHPDRVFNVGARQT